MPSDFSGQNLRGRSFKGQDLSGADFSEADIRGANFTKADLKAANFTKAKAGLQPHWAIILLTVSFILSTIAGFFATLAGYLAKYGFIPGYSNYNPIMGSVVWVILVIFSAFLIWQGLENALRTVIVGVSISVAIAVAFEVVFEVALATPVAVAFAGAFAVAVAIAVAIAGAVAVTIAVIVAGSVGIFAGAFAGAFVGAVAVAVAFARAVPVSVAFDRINFDAVTVAVAVAFAFAGVVMLSSSYVASRALKGDKKYASVRHIAVAVAATGGTSFREADLTNAIFNKAKLKSTDLRQAIVNQTNWRSAEQVDLARVDGTILIDLDVQALLVTGKSKNKCCRNRNFKGANLSGADLTDADFTEADLSGATLERACLERANLTKAQVVGTNFYEAKLTGTCLQAWNIDNRTNLKGVDCKYVFLLKDHNEFGSRDRRPHDPDKLFQPGDFEKFFKGTLDTVQILIRDGINREAFKTALKTIQEKYPDVTVKGIEEQNQDVLVRLQVPSNIDKGKVEQDWEAKYKESKLEAEKNTTLLEIERRRSDAMSSILANLNLLPNITINATAMNQNPNISANQGSFVNTGSMSSTNSAFNLSEVNGNVTHTNELKNTVTPESPTSPSTPPS